MHGFNEIWAADFEYVAPPGEWPDPVCMVARELRSGREIRLWRGEFGPGPPYPVEPDSLFVAYHAPAELSCHLVFGWPAPASILDLSAEFRAHTNGRLPRGSKRGLLDALVYFGLDAMGAEEKLSMRNLILSGGPWSEAEREAILLYCRGDVDALERLFRAMIGKIDLPRALLRGKYTVAVAAMEHTGIPLDLPMLERLRDRWSGLKDGLIEEIDRDYGVFEGVTFKAVRFEAWLARSRIPWPRLEGGALSLADQTFKDMARAYPVLAPLRELRSSLSKLRLNDLAVGSDGRNRVGLSPFGARTGRNTPSNSRGIFGPATWIRCLIRPEPGYGLAYVDWSQQEFGIAAALSGDPAMQAAYLSGDPYLAFGKQAGKIPPDGTKGTHGAARELFKTCVLGVQYGMEAPSMAQRIGVPPVVTRDLLQAHRDTYPRFWKWSDAVVDHAMLHGELRTEFGWPLHITANTNPRALRNFPMQANGAEMLRIACWRAVEQGLEICCPVHDAVLIRAPLDRLEAEAARMRIAMAEASCAVLAGFELRSDAALVRFPDHYSDPRGVAMWSRVCRLLDDEQLVAA